MSRNRNCPRADTSTLPLADTFKLSKDLLFIEKVRDMRAAGSSGAVSREGPERRRAPCTLRFTSERPLEIPQHHRRGVAAGEAADIAARVAAAAAEVETRDRHPVGAESGDRPER